MIDSMYNKKSNKHSGPENFRKWRGERKRWMRHYHSTLKRSFTLLSTKPSPLYNEIPFNVHKTENSCYITVNR